MGHSRTGFELESNLLQVVTPGLMGLTGRNLTPGIRKGLAFQALENKSSFGERVLSAAQGLEAGGGVAQASREGEVWAV